ncbi:hypothetical protein JC2156_16390 [Weissella koreensis KCTC 3621]|nr:hypothetical protein JC2156_16390 [Weissella koreensis KCTC 3621]
MSELVEVETLFEFEAALLSDAFESLIIFEVDSESFFEVDAESLISLLSDSEPKSETDALFDAFKSLNESELDPSFEVAFEFDADWDASTSPSESNLLFEFDLF